TQYGHAFRVLKAYETWLAGGEEGRRQLAILRLLGLFDRPADPGCLAALRQPPAIPGLTEGLVNPSDAAWNIAVKQLEEIGLLTLFVHEVKKVFGYSKNQAKHGPSSLRKPNVHPAIRVIHHPFSLEVHPLLREYFATRLRSDSEPAWEVGH